MPDVARNNRILAQASAGYVIRGDELVATRHLPAVPVPERITSF
jgi:hypothetical protein